MMDRTERYIVELEDVDFNLKEADERLDLEVERAKALLERFEELKKDLEATK